MAKKPEKLSSIIPAALAYARSIAPTAGRMFGADFSGVTMAEGTPRLAHLSKATCHPIEISIARGRGTISNYADGNPVDRVGVAEKSLEKANPFSVEQALLPADVPFLVVASEVKFLANALAPEMCDSPAFTEILNSFAKAYDATGGFHTLATRYLLQMVNGSWLWRNRSGIDVEVSIATPDGLTLIVEEADIDMQKGYTLDALAPKHHPAFIELRDRIAAALGTPGELLLLRMHGLVNMGAGAEVYPSQELVTVSDEDKANAKAKGNAAPSKILSRQAQADGRSIATMHATKIGNAIRTIDTWHGQPGIGAIAVEPYGAQTQLAMAHRVSGNDLYSHLKAIGGAPVETFDDTHHFVMACLIRGGVYGMKSKA